MTPKLTHRLKSNPLSQMHIIMVLLSLAFIPPLTAQDKHETGLPASEDPYFPRTAR